MKASAPKPKKPRAKPVPKKAPAKKVRKTNE
jgi:hypothetical protein